MKIALVDEMRQIDKEAIETYHMSELVLMENAGRSVVQTTAELLNGLDGKNICVLAGSGNNGGDAFVAARYFHNCHARVRIFFIGDSSHSSKSSLQNREICSKLNIPIRFLNDEAVWDQLKTWLMVSHVVIDGILGTGFHGKLQPMVERLIDEVNASGTKVVSIDIPSGVNADTGFGDAETKSIQATRTITFGLPKVGHFFSLGARSTKELIVNEICLPKKLLQDGKILQNYLDDDLARSLLPVRACDVHKNSCGRVLIIAGSKGMSGAAALASRAVLRSGAGLATLATPACIAELLSVKLTEVMVTAMPDLPSGVLSDDALVPLLEKAKNFDVVLLGCGLGRDPETTHFVREFTRKCESKMILDADAIFAWNDHTEELLNLKNNFVMTPHLGEMASLLKIDVPTLRKDLLNLSRKAARDWHSVFVVKSECTIIVYPEGKVYFSSKGNPNMATAGTGDVLAGTIAGITAQMMNTEKDKADKAPLLGVYLHGLAGDIAAQEKGTGLLAGDIVENIPAAQKILANGNAAQKNLQTIQQKSL